MVCFFLHFSSSLLGFNVGKVRYGGIQTDGGERLMANAADGGLILEFMKQPVHYPKIDSMNFPFLLRNRAVAALA